jgi:hypothetical protein
LTFFKAVVFNSADDTIDSNISAMVGSALLKVSTSMSVGGGVIAIVARYVLLQEPGDVLVVVVQICS